MTAVGRAPVVAAWGAGRDRWPRHICDWAARIATLAAGLCPTLSSLGGAVVGVLLAVATCAVGLRALAVVEVAAGPTPRRSRRPRCSRSVVPVYSVRKLPRSCSSGTTVSAKSSRPPGVMWGTRTNPSQRVGLHELVHGGGDGGRGADEVLPAGGLDDDLAQRQLLRLRERAPLVRDGDGVAVHPHAGPALGDGVLADQRVDSAGSGPSGSRSDRSRFHSCSANLIAVWPLTCWLRIWWAFSCASASVSPSTNVVAGMIFSSSWLRPYRASRPLTSA